MTGEKSGLPAALDAVDPGVPEDDAEQLPLLPLASKAAAVAEGEGRRGPGRPPGAKNRRTKEWAEFLFRRYRSPLVVLAETYSRPVGELARELGCDKLEAYKLQRDAAAALAPYLHQKQPQAIDISDAKLVTLNIIMGGEEPPPAPDDAVVLEATVIDGEASEINDLPDKPQPELDATELDGKG